MDLQNEDIWRSANQNQRNIPTSTNQRKSKVDKLISEIVGRDVLTTDPTLMKLLVEWKGKIPPVVERQTDKNGKEFAVEKPVNLLENEDFIKALKETYA